MKKHAGVSARSIKSFLGLSFLRLAVFISILFLLLFLLLIFTRGAQVLSLRFLFGSPRMGMTKGGIFPAIVGTLYLTLLSSVIAFPFGLLTAVYLAEYGKPLWLIRMIRVAINTLSGVPSIIFGLFGLALFVNAMGMGVSLLAGSCTLAILIMPIIINASEEAIRFVPSEFREASYALGANKPQTIIRVVIPAALPSILTGFIISIGRAAGETAPILFTAATFYTRKLPSSLMHEVMALPYHIYALMTEGTAPKTQVPIAYGTAIVLLLLVLVINLGAIIVRYKIRRKRKW